MDEILVIKARIRKRDKDIQQAVGRLNLEEGELSDMIRDGLRKMLTEMGVMGNRSSKSVEAITAQQVARELMGNMRTERSGY